MRCRMFCTVPSEPSAIWATLMPSCTLLLAWVRPLIWLVRPWLIARPDESSAALLMRRPDESWANALFRFVWFMFRLLYAFSAATLVLMTRLIVCLRNRVLLALGGRTSGCPGVGRRSIRGSRTRSIGPPRINLSASLILIWAPADEAELKIGRPLADVHSMQPDASSPAPFAPLKIYGWSAGHNGCGQYRDRPADVGPGPGRPRRPRLLGSRRGHPGRCRRRRRPAALRRGPPRARGSRWRNAPVAARCSSPRSTTTCGTCTRRTPTRLALTSPDVSAGWRTTCGSPTR